ncbi:GNAT family N-acetyltransferase [Solemya elarraichensis gill symbiont]|uniref:GNAT family N-acetyltransferase n=1 Tax=Solemya elarraichensis gill symbiont TaxID=1918949 RepID=A0A1T2LCU5_9GAMM|nr:GNAT family N-acetyltransferase [Solemya elarraichensis gill symbiont]OOZ42911.1 GNAT family N-acetyltransferase [Solemya elarraichensis gill symbiont]
MKLEIIQADYSNKKHRGDIPMLLDAYASGPMVGGTPLKAKVKQNLVHELSRRPYAFSVIAYVDECPAGLVNCFEAFSTFACKPLANIHDVMVLNKYRGNGICQKMLEKVESIAIARGCSKLTLEVLTNNDAAKAAYEKFGFTG